MTERHYCYSRVLNTSWAYMHSLVPHTSWPLFQEQIVLLYMCTFFFVVPIVKCILMFWWSLLSSKSFHSFFSAGASKKMQSMTFSTEHRADLLTEALVSCMLSWFSYRQEANWPVTSFSIGWALDFSAGDCRFKTSVWQVKWCTIVDDSWL